MDSLCADCQEKATLVCLCKDVNLCKNCSNKHKKGTHKLITIGDPDLEAIRLDFEKKLKAQGKKRKVQKPKKLTKEEPTKTPEQIEEEKKQEELKQKLIEKLNQEIANIDQVRKNAVSEVTSQASKLVNYIVEEFDKSRSELCSHTDEPISQFEEAIKEIDSTPENQELNRENPILAKAIDYASTSERVSLITCKGQVKEHEISLAGTLTFNITFEPPRSFKKVKDFYEANIDTINESLKPFFQEVISQNHFETTQIKLNKANLGKEGAKQLAMLLPSYVNVKLVKLNDNGLGSDGAKKLASGLAKMKWLQKLHITKNSLGKEGAHHIAAGVQDIKELKELDLSNNKLGIEGCKFVSLAIKKLVELRTIRLSNNNLASESARHLSSALVGLKKLKSLKLVDNAFSPEDKNVISKTANKTCKLET